MFVLPGFLRFCCVDWGAEVEALADRSGTENEGVPGASCGLTEEDGSG